MYQYPTGYITLLQQYTSGISGIEHDRQVWVWHQQRCPAHSNLLIITIQQSELVLCQDIHQQYHKQTHSQRRARTHARTQTECHKIRMFHKLPFLIQKVLYVQLIRFHSKTLLTALNANQIQAKLH